MATTGKEPKKESAMTAPATGKRKLQPRTMLYIFVAVMLFTLNSVSRYTSKFDDHPPATRVRPIRVPASNSLQYAIFRPSYYFYLQHRERARERPVMKGKVIQPPFLDSLVACSPSSLGVVKA